MPFAALVTDWSGGTLRLTGTDRVPIIGATNLENSAPMADEAIPATYDVEGRAEVRAAIKAYMKANGIGVPTLWDRVSRADPKHREISLPTLQRFVRGTHHTGDMLVEMCVHFLRAEDFPIVPESAQEVFASALAQFHVAADDTPKPIHTDLRKALAGTYLPVRSQEAEHNGTETELTITDSDDERFLLVGETESTDAGISLSEHEGALIVNGPLVYIALRDKLTGVPKSYYLERLKAHESYPGTYLSGHVIAQAGFRVVGDQTSTISRAEPILIESGRAANAVD